MACKDKEKNFVCSHEGCTAAFSRLGRLEIHLRTHTGERPFICSYEDCTKSFISSSHLNRHEAAHEPNFIRCPYENCGTVLKTKATYTKHLSRCHADGKTKVFKCKECGDEFKRRRHLRGHSYKHSGVKPYVCPWDGCDKSFLYCSRLKQHMRVHEGYPCSYEKCDVVCSTWSLYRKHMKVVHPRTYKCDICKKTFSLSYNFRMHKKTHTDPRDRECFFCEFPNCPRFYSEKRNLIQHIKQYHDKRPYACTHEGCGSSFQTKDGLKKHSRVHDPSIPDSKKKKKKKKKCPSFAAKLAGLDADTEKALHQLSVAQHTNTNSMNEEKTNEPVAENEKICNIDDSNVNLPTSKELSRDEENNQEPVDKNVGTHNENESKCHPRDVDSFSDIDSSSYQVITFTYEGVHENIEHVISPVKNLNMMDSNRNVLFKKKTLSL